MNLIIILFDREFLKFYRQHFSFQYQVGDLALFPFDRILTYGLGLADQR
jgi:hypothetical protein